MALSSVSMTVEEGFALEVGTFNRNGSLHLMWVTQAGMKTQLWWRPHTGARFTEIAAQMSAVMKNLSALYQPSTDSILLFWDDSAYLYRARLAYLTGAVLTAPEKVAIGVKPTLVKRNSSDSNLLLSYLVPGKSIFVRESLNAGISWGLERPVLSNRVLTTTDLIVFPFDDEHLSIMQVGLASRAVLESGSLLRTRPVTNLAWHPSDTSKIYASEPNGAEGDLSDNLRGGLCVSMDGSSVFNIGGGRLGSDDGVGAVSLLNISENTPSVVSSATPGSATGSTLNKMDLTPSVLSSTALGSVGKLVGLDCSSAVLYAVKRSDVANPTNGGYLYAVLLSDLSFSAVLSGLAACRAVSVGIPPTGTPTIFVATKEGAQETLRVYSENGLTPTLQATHKLPAVTNGLAAYMISETQGTLVICSNDRIGIYEIDGLANPVRMRLNIPVLSVGRFMQAKKASNGNIVAAMGNGGVAVFGPSGEMISQIRPSEILAPEWTPKTYALNDLVRPSVKSPFAPQRVYYKCTSGGASGTNEPKWTNSGTTPDGSAVWTYQGSTDTFITSVLLDTVRKRIYAAGVMGGAQGTQGRIFVLPAANLLGV